MTMDEMRYRSLVYRIEVVGAVTFLDTGKDGNVPLTFKFIYFFN